MGLHEARSLGIRRTRCNAGHRGSYKKGTSNQPVLRAIALKANHYEGMIMLEINKAAGPKMGIIKTVPTWINTVAWFVRICGVLIVVASTAGIIQAGWPHSLHASGSLLGLLNGTLLFVVSFIFVTTGRTRNIMTATTIVLGVAVMVFSLAKLGLPHL